MTIPASSLRQTLLRRHLIAAWSGLLLFIFVGLGLELFHAFKTPLFLDVEQETRRLMWRLCHAHGALLSILNLAVAWNFSVMDERAFPRAARLVSRSHLAALILLPAGFFLGGLSAVDGDPGLGIVLVPAGGVFLAAAVLLSWKEARRLLSK